MPDIRYARNGDVEIAYETFGDPADDAMPCVSPDGQYIAFGQSDGGSDWQQTRLVEVGDAVEPRKVELSAGSQPAETVLGLAAWYLAWPTGSRTA